MTRTLGVWFAACVLIAIAGTVWRWLIRWTNEAKKRAQEDQ